MSRACACLLTWEVILPTSRRVNVAFLVLLLKVAREVWTKSRATVWFKGRRVGQPKHKSSVDSTYCQRVREVVRLRHKLHDSVCAHFLQSNNNKVAFCVALKCGDSQNSSDFVQHHITVSLYCLIGDKELHNSANDCFVSILVIYL